MIVVFFHCCLLLFFCILINDTVYFNIYLGIFVSPGITAPVSPQRLSPRGAAAGQRTLGPGSTRASQRRGNGDGSAEMGKVRVWLVLAPVKLTSGRGVVG